MKPLPSDLRVRLLEPKMVHEQMADEAALNRVDPAIAANLMEKAAAALQRSGCVVLRATSGAGASAGALSQAAELSEKSEQLLRVFVPEEVRSLLSAFAASSTGEMVLVLAVKIKSGPEGAWSPLTGVLRSAMTSTLFRAAIIDPASARVLWQNEAYLRALPALGNQDYEQATALLFNAAPTLLP